VAPAVVHLSVELAGDLLAGGAREEARHEPKEQVLLWGARSQMVPVTTLRKVETSLSGPSQDNLECLVREGKWLLRPAGTVRRM
jgi:hypothetical protein